MQDCVCARWCVCAGRWHWLKRPFRVTCHSSGWDLNLIWNLGAIKMSRIRSYWQQGSGQKCVFLLNVVSFLKETSRNLSAFASITEAVTGKVIASSGSAATTDVWWLFSAPDNLWAGCMNFSPAFSLLWDTDHTIHCCKRFFAILFHIQVLGGIKFTFFRGSNSFISTGHCGLTVRKSKNACVRRFLPTFYPILSFCQLSSKLFCQFNAVSRKQCWDTAVFSGRSGK